MPIYPKNCYKCKKPWFGAGPICDACLGITPPPPPPPFCFYCNKPGHDTADCLIAAVALHSKMATCGKCGQTHFGTFKWCDQCLQRYPPPHYGQPHIWCSYCGNTTHQTISCPIMKASTFFQNYSGSNTNMRRRRNSNSAFHYQYQPPLKACPACKGNYLIETKAGSVCSSCRSVVHNPCRNCDSLNTKGTSGDGMQFIECRDCLFIE